jgi:hypothetical protein
MRRINVGCALARSAPRALADHRRPAAASTRGVEAQPPLLYDETAIFYVEHPGTLGDRTGLLRPDPELEPEGLGSECDGLARHVGRLGRRSEDIDQPERLGNVGEGPVHGFSEDLFGVRIDRNDAPSMSLHVRRHRVRSLRRRRADPDHRDGSVGPEHVLDEFVGVVHEFVSP